MPTKLALKNRKEERNISIPISEITALLALPEGPGQVALWRHFQALKDAEVTIHDAVWLKMFVNWVPEGGSPLTEQARWLKIARKVGELKKDAEEITLTLSECDLLWERMQDPKFKIVAMTSAFSELVLDFIEATGHQFSTVKKDAEDV